MIPDRITWRVHGLDGNKSTVEWVRSDMHDQAATALAEAEAEIERLREALTEAVRILSLPFGVIYDSDAAIAQAHAALNTPRTETPA